MKLIFKYFKKSRFIMIIGLIIKIIGTLMDLAIPYILEYIIDDLLILKEVKVILLYGGLMVLCAIIGVLFNVIANQMAARVAREVTRQLRHDLFVKVQQLSMHQIDEVTMPSLISRLSSDTYNVHQMVGMMQRIGVRAPILLIGGICVSFLLNKKLTMILLLCMPLIFIATYVVSKIGIPLFTKVQKAIDDIIRTIRENITGARVIKALSKGEYEKKKFQKINKAVIDLELKSGYVMSLLNPIINILLNGGLVIVIIVGAHLVNDKEIKVGVIISFTSYFTIISTACLSITRIFIVFSRSLASANRINYIMSLPEELQIKESTKQQTNYIIEFKDVNFSYNKKVNNLTNINFQIKRNESLGVIGKTGSGKTSIVNLLMRFYDCDSGQILVNGKNVQSYGKEELKKMFGTVFQNDIIFNDTIIENINFGRNIDRKEIKKAIKCAQAEEFIKKEKQGLLTVLTPKGTNISGGQKQRLLIARALAGNPQILILDDSSSALDYKTDSLLRSSINQNYPNLSTIIITQRVSSIIHCDHILIIDEGKIIGYGTHEELLEKMEEYRNLYKIQMGEFYE